MVTRDTVFPVRIKFFFIFEFAILSAFSLITDDGKINRNFATTPSYLETREQIENTPTNNGPSLGLPNHKNSIQNSVDLENSTEARISQPNTERKDNDQYSNTTLFLLPMSDTRWSGYKDTNVPQPDFMSSSTRSAKTSLMEERIFQGINRRPQKKENFSSVNTILSQMPNGPTTGTNRTTPEDANQEVINLKLKIFKKRKEIEPVPNYLVQSGSSNVNSSFPNETGTRKESTERGYRKNFFRVREAATSLKNVPEHHSMKMGLQNRSTTSKNETMRKKSVEIVPPEANVEDLISGGFTNTSLSANTTHRRGKEFISEETLMESRNYNYDPGYPSYNQQPLTGNPTGSGADAYNVQTFATITRDFWPNYQQDIATYPTITTAKTPRAPQFPVSPNRWRFPMWNYRQKLRGTYPKDEPSFYDYIEEGDSSPLESMNMHRWSPPSSGPASAGSNVSPVRSEFHRYHEGGGGYDYSPHYDFAHVHEHSGHGETHDTGYKMDYTKLGLLLLLKLAIAKLKALGALQILLLLLLKAKLLLAMMALKFFMVLKALKLVKYLIAPLLLSSLLPLLLLGPLSLLPALLPLLMNLTPMPEEPEEPPDVPDVPDEPDMMPDGDMRRKKKHKSRGLGQIQRVLRSEDCLQRIACEMAAKRQLSLVPVIVTWSLECLAKMAPIPMIKAYAKAYAEGRQMEKSSSGCATKYKCDFFSKKRS